MKYIDVYRMIKQGSLNKVGVSPFQVAGNWISNGINSAVQDIKNGLFDFRDTITGQDRQDFLNLQRAPAEFRPQLQQMYREAWGLGPRYDQAMDRAIAAANNRDYSKFEDLPGKNYQKLTQFREAVKNPSKLRNYSMQPAASVNPLQSKIQEKKPLAQAPDKPIQTQDWIFNNGKSRLAGQKKAVDTVISNVSRPSGIYVDGKRVQSQVPAYAAPKGQEGKGQWKQVAGGRVWVRNGQTFNSSPGSIVPVDNPSSIAETPAKASTEPQKQAPALARQLPRRGASNAGYDNWRRGLAERRADFRKRRPV